MKKPKQRLHFVIYSEPSFLNSVKKLRDYKELLVTIFTSVLLFTGTS